MESNKPLVSLIITTYNRAGIIIGALDGAISQGYENLEIVVSDNGSTDLTKEIVDKYIQKDKRIKYYRNVRNLGAIGNHHQAFKNYAKGDWAIFVSDDDAISDSEFITKGMKCIMQQESEVAFYQTGFITLNEKSNERIVARPNKEALLEVVEGVEYFKRYFERSFFSFTTTLFNRRAVLENKLDVNYFTTDVELMLALALQNNRVCIFSNEIGGVYRLHEKQTYGAADFRNYVALYTSYKTIYKLAKSVKYLSAEEYEQWRMKAEMRFKKDIVNLLVNQYKGGLNGFSVVRSSLMFRLICYLDKLFKYNFLFLADQGNWIFNRRGLYQELYWKKFKKISL